MPLKPIKYRSKYFYYVNPKMDYVRLKKMLSVKNVVLKLLEGCE